MSSQEYDKDRTVQQKKRKSAFPKIASPSMMDTCEDDGKNKKFDEEKEAEFPDDTSTVDMEEGVNYRKDDSDEKNDKEKLKNSLMTLSLLLWRPV